MSTETATAVTSSAAAQSADTSSVQGAPVRRSSISLRMTKRSSDLTNNTVSQMLPSFISKKFALEVIAGGAGGGISRTIVAPLERVKVLLQVQELALSKSQVSRPYSGIMDALVRIPKEQGFLAYWRGNGVNVIRIVPNSAIKFSTFDHFKRLTFPGGEDKYKKDYRDFTLRKLACGGLSGVVTIIPIYPLDLARTRLTADVRTNRMYKGLFDCLKQTFKNEGFTGLYKGLGISVFGIIPYLAISLTLYDTLKDFAREGPEFFKTPFGKVALGSTAALISQSIVYPLDTLRRHMQVSGAVGEADAYKNTFDCIRRIYRSSGVKGFYKGLWANAVRAAPQSGIEYMCYDEIRRIFQ